MSDSEKLDLILDQMTTLHKGLNGMDEKFAGMDKRLDGMDEKFAGMDKRLDDMDKQFDVVREDIMALDVRMDVMAEKVTDTRLYVENTLDHNIQLIAENHMSLVDKLNQAIRVSDKTILYEIQVSGLKMRVDRIEADLAEIKGRLAS